MLSSTLFVQELKRAKKETKERVEELGCGGNDRGSAMRGKTLMATVDKRTLDQLYKLRDGVPWG